MFDRAGERSAKIVQSSRCWRKSLLSIKLAAIVHVGVQVLEVCLDRFREKKTNVIEALREAADAAYPGVGVVQLKMMPARHELLSDQLGTNGGNRSDCIGSQDTDRSTVHSAVLDQVLRHGHTNDPTQESPQNLSSTAHQGASLSPLASVIVLSLLSIVEHWRGRPSSARQCIRVSGDAVEMSGREAHSSACDRLGRAETREGECGCRQKMLSWTIGFVCIDQRVCGEGDTAECAW